MEGTVVDQISNANTAATPWSEPIKSTSPKLELHIVIRQILGLK
jgi:hypothetical protein